MDFRKIKSCFHINEKSNSNANYVITFFIVVTLLCTAHPPPPNLLEVECAIYKYAQEFGTKKFPAASNAVSNALHRALILERCNDSVVRYDTDKQHLSGYRMETMPRSFYHESRNSKQHRHLVTTIFVATTGDDLNGDGSEAKPFATLQRVQKEIRKTPVSSRPAITVEVRAGTYYMSKTLAFGPEDSGANDVSRVLWRPYKNESVTISGGIKLDLDWQPYQGNFSGQAYMAKLPKGTPTNFTSLFIDNTRAIWARWPNGNPADVTGMCFSRTQYPEYGEGCHGYATPANGMVFPVPLPKAFHLKAGTSHPGLLPRYGMFGEFDMMVNGFASLFEAPNGQCVAPGTVGTVTCNNTFNCTVPCDIPGSMSWFAHYDRLQGRPAAFSFDPNKWTENVWKNPERTGVVRSFVGMDWGSGSYPLRGIDLSNHTIFLGSGGWQIGDNKGVKNYYIEGIKEELDAPREWVVDTDSHTIFYFPNQTSSIPFTISSSSKTLSKCTLHGELTDCCLDLQNWSTKEHARFALDNCHPNHKGQNQLFLYNNQTNQLRIQVDNKCLTGTKNGIIEADTCVNDNQDQLWNFQETLLYNHNGCLAAAVSLDEPFKDATALTIKPCNKSDLRQQFLRTNYQTNFVSNDIKPPTLTEAVLLDTVVSFKGSIDQDVKYIEFSGFRITHAATTQLKEYEVPSGGDWAVGRYAALTVEAASHIAITGNFFDSVGGNAIGIFNRAKNNSISGNRCGFPGDSCVVVLGTSNLVDGTRDTFPRDNLIANNWFHDIGIYGKETSCYFQAIAGKNTLQDNICYNGPRAGINFNDGFFGDNHIEGNLIFNMVRETGDHGPFNSWDRVPYITQRPNGSFTSTPIRNHIIKNFIINGYNGVWSLDHDDGSSYYNDTSNFLVYGGCKNYKGDHKFCGPNNVIIYPGINSRSTGGRSCQTNDNVGFYFDYYIGNKCVQYDGQFYTFKKNPLDKSGVPFTSNNEFFSPGSKFDYGGKGLKDLQNVGLDLGSTVKDLPTPDEMVAWGKAALE